MAAPVSPSAAAVDPASGGTTLSALLPGDGHRTCVPGRQIGTEKLCSDAVNMPRHVARSTHRHRLLPHRRRQRESRSANAFQVSSCFRIITKSPAGRMRLIAHPYGPGGAEKISFTTSRLRSTSTGTTLCVVPEYR
jgi:hypothetical protein